jgi:hypothetical protein
MKSNLKESYPILIRFAVRRRTPLQHGNNGAKLSKNLDHGLIRLNQQDAQYLKVLFNEFIDVHLGLCHPFACRA